jgi:hypothetical protein
MSHSAQLGVTPVTTPVAASRWSWGAITFQGQNYQELNGFQCLGFISEHAGELAHNNFRVAEDTEVRNELQL